MGEPETILTRRSFSDPKSDSHQAQDRKKRAPHARNLDFLKISSVHQMLGLMG
jgi:hypothetical protein